MTLLDKDANIDNLLDKVEWLEERVKNLETFSLTGSLTTAYLEWINVKDHGAEGDGSTDDTDYINGAISAIPSTGGILYFPPGEYYTTGGFELDYPTLVLGGGRAIHLGTDAVTQVDCDSATAVLFTCNADWSLFQDIALKNVISSTPSAGSGIKVISSHNYQSVSYENVSVYGFYIDVDVQVGAYWTMNRCAVLGPVLYGLKIQNTVSVDVGDWNISNTNFNTGDYDPDSAIRIESSGGGKIVNCKINKSPSATYFTRGIDLYMADGDQTSNLLVANTSIENLSSTGTGIYMATAGTGLYQHIMLVNNQISIGNTSGYAIYMNSNTAGYLRRVSILGNMLSAQSGNTNAAIDLTNVNDGFAIGNIDKNFGSLISRTSCSNFYIVDPTADIYT